MQLAAADLPLRAKTLRQPKFLQQIQRSSPLYPEAPDSPSGDPRAVAAAAAAVTAPR